MSKKWNLLLCALTIMLAANRIGFPDTIEQIESLDPLAPVTFDAVPDLVPITGEIRPDDNALHGGESSFGFLVQMDFIPGTDSFVMVTWSQQGGWQGPSRAAVQKYDAQGNLTAGPTSVQDEGEESFGHGFAWDVGAFADGTIVAAGPARFGLQDIDDVPLSIINISICATQLFDADLNRVGELHSTFEPELVPGNDNRDGDEYLKPRIAVIGNDRYVVSAVMKSAKLQAAVGLTDDGSSPAPKVYYRVFEKDGTPIGPTRWAFPVSDADGGWSANQSDHDIAARPGGGFAMVASGIPLTENGDHHAIYFFDNNGDPDGEPFGVVDQDLIDNAVENQSIVQPEISQANGIYALGSSIQVFGSNDFALTLFDDDRNIIRSTINGIGEQDLSAVRESDINQDPSGNVFMTTRGTYNEGPDADSDMVTVRLITNEGEYFTPSFVPYPPAGYPGSQRDPVVIASRNLFVVAYLSDAPPSDVGGMNTFRIFQNPFPQEPVSQVKDWSLY